VDRVDHGPQHVELELERLERLSLGFHGGAVLLLGG